MTKQTPHTMKPAMHKKELQQRIHLGTVDKKTTIVEGGFNTLLLISPSFGASVCFVFVILGVFTYIFHAQKRTATEDPPWNGR